MPTSDAAAQNGTTLDVYFQHGDVVFQSRNANAIFEWLAIDQDHAVDLSEWV